MRKQFIGLKNWALNNPIIRNTYSHNENNIAMKFNETEKVELKRRYTDSIERSIIAFLNTDGGTVYIGVDDDGKIVGVDKVDETFKRVSELIYNGISPNAKDFVELGSKYIDGKIIIEIRIAKGDGLYYIKKYGRSSQGCFLRMGTTCRAMTEYEIERCHTRILNSKIKLV